MVGFMLDREDTNSLPNLGRPRLYRSYWHGRHVVRQETPAPKPPAQSVPSQDGTLHIVALPCVQPQPMVTLQDYNGPLKKVLDYLPSSWNGSRCTRCATSPA